MFAFQAIDFIDEHKDEIIKIIKTSPTPLFDLSLYNENIYKYDREPEHTIYLRCFNGRALAVKILNIDTEPTLETKILKRDIKY